MEGLTSLVSESLARHGFDRPLDYRRLKWSRWFRCESHHSLLFVPSKPGVFAVAEEILSAGTENPESEARRMLAVSQFYEADDMAYVLDRMLSRQHPMRTRLESGRYFIRFVVIEEASQRRSIASALNQWIANSAEKPTGIGPHFASSLELTPAAEENRMGTAALAVQGSEASVNATLSATPPATSGAATNINCPSPFPSGF
ncbi:MAG TPA: hypothetical protein VMF66_03015 [Candidatus Acidoferrum sp.]|nr:hypothetical protein [Candidatus Acidoferrum sp.]HTZ84810.1 hypothetical protein [Candidatus Acidoferrales bacterium]